MKEEIEFHSISLIGKSLHNLLKVTVIIQNEETCLAHYIIDNVIKMFCPRQTQSSTFDVKTSGKIEIYEINVYSREEILKNLFPLYSSLCRIYSYY